MIEDDEGSTITILPQGLDPQDLHAPRPELLALVIAWSAAEPGRVGEVALLEPGPPAWVLGRGGPRPDDPGPRLSFCRQRPGRREPVEPLGGPGLSRQQLRLRLQGDGVLVERIGQCPLSVSGSPADQATARAGDTLLLKDQILLYVTRRPLDVAPLCSYPGHLLPAFGQPDPGGIVGESPPIWALRDRLAFFARSPRHVLILGESGTGKELAARALHRLSGRARGRLLSRNAATVPAELIDAELFGNARNYPNPGMPERAGLIGEADGGTLFLDEIGELPAALQAHLLRVLDSGGEYHRLGEGLLRRADLRLIGATNRALSELKHDLAARLTLQLRVPGLPERAEDVPLLLRHLLKLAAQANAELGRFLTPAGEPRVQPALIDRLLRHPYRTHVRELDRLLWQAMAESPGECLVLTPELMAQLSATGETAPDPGPARLLSCLKQHGHNVSAAARALGMSRFALYRLMKKHGLALPPRKG
jgi:two-component system nitrogen regulation response regulator GlnG/two-component system response regulator HydG